MMYDELLNGVRRSCNVLVYNIPKSEAVMFLKGVENYMIRIKRILLDLVRFPSRVTHWSEKAWFLSPVEDNIW